MRVPWVTLSLVAFSLATYLQPAWSAALIFDRGAIEGGEFYRFLSAHFVHASDSHLAWDIAAFAGIGASIERRSRVQLFQVIGASVLPVTLAVWWWQPELYYYAGLSGLCSALLVALVAACWREVRAPQQRARRQALILLTLCFVLKLVFEFLTERSVFAAPGSFVPVPLAHLVGAACASTCIAFQRLRPHWKPLTSGPERAPLPLPH